MNKDKKQKMLRFKLSSLFSITIFIIMLATAFLTFLGIQLLIHFKILDIDYPMLPILFFDFISILVGTVAASFISKNLLKPLHIIIDATEKITEGDYSTRLPFEDIQIQEFEQLGEKFNHMAEELGSVEILRNDFINNFSHEFNTPINSIQGFATLLKHGNLSEEEQNDYLDRIISGSDRLSTLAVNVLNLSKIEQQTILTHKEKINVTEQIRRIIVMLSMRWEKKDIEFEFDCKEYFLTGNEEFLDHLWLNLLDNAIKYSPLQSTIVVDIKETAHKLEIMITDHGKGIAEDALPHIFDKFYRSKSSRAVPGTGLGLTIAHKVVTLHRGTIRVTSAPSQGTSFTVTLPKE